ncbi:hypothetical protein AO368_1418 [Moraxella catarrhalis]|nr:hypothetical protein AO376_1387 [Moraxella catarrhalis]OAV21689.1 hypothetical protein AO374_0022 [Moraxella catarrhalis]OAV28572.1 hypothetical protein AO368_1418 [Moraxella catarrhalis]
MNLIYEPKNIVLMGDIFIGDSFWFIDWYFDLISKLVV